MGYCEPFDLFVTHSGELTVMFTWCVFLLHAYMKSINSILSYAVCNTFAVLLIQFIHKSLDNYFTWDLLSILITSSKVRLQRYQYGIIVRHNTNT